MKNLGRFLISAEFLKEPESEMLMRHIERIGYLELDNGMVEIFGRSHLFPRLKRKSAVPVYNIIAEFNQGFRKFRAELPNP